MALDSLVKLFGLSSLAGGGAGLASNIFSGNPSAPYNKAMGQMKNYAGQAASFQNPFYSAGTAAIPQYQDYLSQMSDPTQFINDIMGDYSESPYAEYEQQQAMRAATNQASANGLSGSTPMQLQAQENAENISNQDMEKWLSHVLGINTQYGQGLQNEINSGQSAANQLTRLYTMLASELAKGTYGAAKAKQNQSSSIFGDLASMGTGALALFGL